MLYFTVCAVFLRVPKLDPLLVVVVFVALLGIIMCAVFSKSMYVRLCPCVLRPSARSPLHYRKVRFRLRPRFDLER